ncbi:MAG TPA: glycoside hydrolase domain-containing protein [Gemmatimonadaceae bacterium]|nr:glycoside hydrolase domain-containing protein [Gemmatimonadaceae bacterium]
MPRIEWRSILALATAGLVLSTGSQFEAPSFGSIGSAVETASAAIADNLSDDGPHLGFDTFAYPGDDAMQAWATAEKPYKWVGYYLSAPCHNDDSWEGKRATLSTMGWGMAVIYVGQQTWGRTPGQKVQVTRYITKRVRQVKTRNGKRVVSYVKKRVPVKVLVVPRASPNASCSSQFVTTARGTADANDAIAKTAAEGFAKGTVIFLDIERMESVPRSMRDYYAAWTRRVLQDGRFRPAYYAHSFNADLIYGDVKQVLAAEGVSAEPPFWIASERGFSVDKAPTEVGHAFAQVWQGVLDVVETHNGVRLPIDVNVARLPSPSENYRGGE